MLMGQRSSISFVRTLSSAVTCASEVASELSSTTIPVANEPLSSSLTASALSAVPLFFQGELWHWQLLITAVIVIIALIIPGHLFRRYVRKQYKE